jgi:hypothetical protein
MSIHAKKCPPGVICIENITLVFLIIILCVLFYIIYIYFFKKQSHISSQTAQTQQQQQQSNQHPQSPQKIDIFNSFYNNTDAGYGYGFGGSNDVLLNPYAPPLRNENIGPVFMPRAVPINVSTNIGAVSPDTNYRQVGILTPINGSKKNSILPLMGRPVFVNRNKWQYYTISDQHNNVKIPISRKGKSCTNEYGCDYIYNGDTVYAEGYNEVFKATVYDNDTMRYLPFL